MTARLCALWSRAANSFLARYAGGLYEFLFEAYLRIKFWKFSNFDVLLKLNIYKILLYDAYHICGVKRLVISQSSPIPSSYSNETMPNAEQFMLTLSEHQTIQPVLVGFYMARALVLVVFVSNYVVVLFSFDIVTNVLISPCIFLLILFDIYPISFFRKIWTWVFIIVCQTVKNTHSNGLQKLLDLSNAFLVEYLLTAISSMPDISTSVLKQKKI
jgi:hypothetical protein